MARVQGALVLLIVLMGCLQAAIADVDCQSSALLAGRIQDCFVKNGIDLKMPLINLQKYYIDAVKNQEVDMCSNKENYKKIVECLSEYAICVPEDTKPYVPSAANGIKIVDTLCDETQKLNHECLVDKAQDVTNCALGKLNASVQEGPAMTPLCMGIRLNAECLGTELRSCGCSTVKAYQIVIMDLWYPSSVCPALTIPRAQCDEANPQEFANTGGQPYTGWAVPFFVSSLLVVLNRFVE